MGLQHREDEARGAPLSEHGSFSLRVPLEVCVFHWRPLAQPLGHERTGASAGGFFCAGADFSTEPGPAPPSLGSRGVHHLVSANGRSSSPAPEPRTNCCAALAPWAFGGEGLRRETPREEGAAQSSRSSPPPGGLRPQRFAAPHIPAFPLL